MHGKIITKNSTRAGTHLLTNIVEINYFSKKCTIQPRSPLLQPPKNTSNQQVIYKSIQKSARNPHHSRSRRRRAARPPPLREIPGPTSWRPRRPASLSHPNQQPSHHQARIYYFFLLFSKHCTRTDAHTPRNHDLVVEQQYMAVRISPYRSRQPRELYYAIRAKKGVKHRAGSSTRARGRGNSGGKFKSRETEHRRALSLSLLHCACHCMLWNGEVVI